MGKNKVYIIDVTNRDGVQTSRLGLAKLEKTMLNLYLDKMGVFQSEYGFPTSSHETNYLKANLELMETGAIKNMRLEGWIRAIPGDVEQCFKLVPRIRHLNLSMSTSRQMIRGKFQGKKNRKDVIEMMSSAVKRARELGAKSIGVNAEDASRTDIDYLVEFSLAAKASGADRIRYCDTLGYDGPFSIHARVKRLALETEMPIELHCHNDLGMAVGNSVAGAKGVLEVGQDAYVNTTINGMGERAGNADLISCVLALEKAADFAGEKLLDKKIDLSKAYRLSKYAAVAFGIPIPVNQVGVGENAFAHESGIHADGVLKERQNYELYDFRELGRGDPEIVETGRSITAGEYSGIKGFRHVMGRFAAKFDDDRHARRILELARYANVHTQKPLVEDELKFIIQHPLQARKILTVTPPKK